MPIYEYRCQKCNVQFDILVGVIQQKTPLRCPGCGSTALKKLMSLFGIAGSSGKASQCSSCSARNCSSCS